MRLKPILCIALLAYNIPGFCQQPDQYSTFLGSNKQLLFVKTAKPTDITGVMYLYHRKSAHKPWKLADSFAVTVGRTGLAWDAYTKIPHSSGLENKKEGDGKSPAGLFKLGPVFSYHSLEKVKMPWQQVDSTDICVDDVKSAYYNRPLDKDSIAKQDWNSFEYMHRQDNAYEYGIWVLYNSTNYTPGMGSCIFLHVWENAEHPTVGCTAMSKDNIIKLIHWLDPKKQPVLLQVTGD
ncbi:MAG TPA: L,D-transpeptidase family protein [Panacibacter sp.]|nr:L,D-transpeptidase family protein [Panacibacter sp.]HNP43601.1 L,D-transpeptidase family protein [Panacibacter sp.]